MAKAKSEAEAPEVPEVPVVPVAEVAPVEFESGVPLDPDRPVVVAATAEELQEAADRANAIIDAHREKKAQELLDAAAAEAAAGMALAESGNDVPSNAALLEWPTDRDGITADLKSALLNAAGRVNGREDKLEVVLAVLSLGAKHILARFEAQVQSNAEAYSWLDKQNHERRSAVRAIGWQPN